jgi:hypothetical protein
MSVINRTLSFNHNDGGAELTAQIPKVTCGYCRKKLEVAMMREMKKRYVH